MQIERRALYNSLRMNWLNNSKLNVEPWQVQDYRSIPLDELFKKLHEKKIDIDKKSFQLFAENVDSPEDLTDEFLLDSDLENKEQDHVYLVIFELWRRFITEKKTLSIFLDELDHQIFLYDHGQLKNAESIEDSLEELSLILDENVESGIGKKKIFETISDYLANDLENFLYDFILDQIEHGNYLYATELLDDFTDFVLQTKWFYFLRIQIQSVKESSVANEAIRKLIQQTSKEEDLEFYFEILSFVAKAGEYDIFITLVKKSLPLIEYEEDFVDLGFLAIDYFDRLDLDRQKEAIKVILDSQSKIPATANFIQNDPQITTFLNIL